MRKKMLALLLLASVALGINLMLSGTALADPPPSPAKQNAAANKATVDITINDAGGMSVGGVNLQSLGVLPLDQQVVNVARNLRDAHLVVNNDQVTLDTQGTEVVKILWTPTSRQTVANLATAYGVALSPDLLNRIEGWISSSNIDVTARFANEASKPLDLDVSRLILVDISSNGQLAVETAPLAAGIDPTALQFIQRGGNQATACWNKGTLIAKVNGAELPTITLNPDGVNMVTKALNLPVDSGAETAVLNSRLGVDVSLPGGSHSANATCS